MFFLIAGIIISYLIGSIPTAYIFGKVLKGVDIRQFGSGNVGATNAMRVLGKGAGISVLILDLLKGFIAVVFLARKVPHPGFISDETVSIVFGLASIFGHIWTVFLKFKGGKGVATSLGVLLGLTFKMPGLKTVFGLTILIWLALFIAIRIVSAASVLSVIVLPLLMILYRQSCALIILSFIVSALVIWSHKSNLKRIFAGKESRISFKKS